MAVVAALVLSSPDDKAVTLQQWARQNPADFVTTAVTELDGTSTSASYGPPYNHAGTGQSIFFCTRRTGPVSAYPSTRRSISCWRPCRR